MPEGISRFMQDKDDLVSRLEDDDSKDSGRDGEGREGGNMSQSNLQLSKDNKDCGWIVIRIKKQVTPEGDIIHPRVELYWWHSENAGIFSMVAIALRWVRQFLLHIGLISPGDAFNMEKQWASEEAMKEVHGINITSRERGMPRRAPGEDRETGEDREDDDPDEPKGQPWAN